MNGETFVIYTTESGGRFKIVKATHQEYLEAVASRQWDETPWDEDCPRGRDVVDLNMVAFLRVEENHDFILGCSRDDHAGIQAWIDSRNKVAA